VIGTATAGNASAVVNWTAPTDNGGSAITGYDVQAFAGTSTVPVSTTTAGAAATSVTVTGLTNGTSYTFKVRAKNVAGVGPLSDASNAVTPAPPVAPGAPTIGAATRGNASALVQWTAPASNGGAAITGYDVRVFLGNTNTTVGALRTAGPAATSLNVTGLTNGTSYTFVVRARNAVGPGPFSARSVAVTPATVSTAPRIGAASSGANGGAINATVRWNAPLNTGGTPITGYQVTALRLRNNGTVQATTISAVLAPGSRSFVFQLAAGNYVFTVTAINAVGTSPPSARSNQVIAR
jgi:hypothetical protein